MTKTPTVFARTIANVGVKYINPKKRAGNDDDKSNDNGKSNDNNNS
jgi:hypothetical protein